jgi:hypothetical protein
MTGSPFQWVRDALARKALVEHMSHYHLSGRTVAATDGSLTVAHPLDYDVPTCLVKGEHFEAAAKAFDSQPSWSVEDNALTLRSNRSRVRIPIIQEHLWSPAKLIGQWRDVPSGLCDMFRAVMPFVASGADASDWISSIAIAEDGIWATDKFVMVRTRRSIDVQGNNVLVPKSVLEFVVDREEGLKRWCITENQIGFEWSNGAWMKASLLLGQWQLATARRIVPTSLAEAEMLELTPEWRESLALLTGAASAAGSVEVTLKNEQMTSEGAGLFIEVSASNMLPEGMAATKWNSERLIKMAQAATHWDPTKQPATFRGMHLLGVVTRNVDAAS